MEAGYDNAFKFGLIESRALLIELNFILMVLSVIFVEL